jgi:hypothetical protein
LIKAGVDSLLLVDEDDDVDEEASVFSLFASMSSSIERDEEVRLLVAIRSNRYAGKSESLNELSLIETQNSDALVF